jgi:hypothetical protein
MREFRIADFGLRILRQGSAVGPVFPIRNPQSEIRNASRATRSARYANEHSLSIARSSNLRYFDAGTSMQPKRLRCGVVACVSSSS